MVPQIKTRPAIRPGVKISVGVAAGLLLLGWLLNTPAGLLGKADAVGYAVCHRIELRSYFLGERQIPLCARCTGMYLGAMLGFGFQAWGGSKRSGNLPPWLWLPLGGFVLAFALDGLNSYIQLFPGVQGLYLPQNWLRTATGTGMGLTISAALFPAFNQTVWATWDGHPGLPGWPSLARLLFLAAALNGLIALNNPLILYPLALLSAAGVMMLLNLVYTMVYLMVLRQENAFLHWRELAFPAVAGFGLALLQIAAMDFVRYVITGSWSGFHFG